MTKRICQAALVYMAIWVLIGIEVQRPGRLQPDFAVAIAAYVLIFTAFLAEGER